MQYKNTQVGIAMLIIMGLVFALLVFASYTKPDESIWFVFVIIGIATFLFSSLTIKIDGTQILWYFGPQFWKKSLELSDVLSVRKIKTKWYSGMGIRLTSTGWLYNVSGLSAVELKLKNGTTVSLGTNDPDNLINAIENRR
ncbi:hypothetical protein QF117_03115 [Vibrio sp. YMD68]|uniref:hypothetical protein n=1 Tax=Vibrio sp. YMD68 TaxID=3042300 RepID=UPI002499C32F|nr:hypothetical protein [Vibrio sp. YMD68]WGV97869.1 hypothetical protein QF117_03115 [Vibrio sp. YMD68]